MHVNLMDTQWPDAIPSFQFSNIYLQHLGAADTEVHETKMFSPKKLSEDGHVQLMELLLFLCDEVCASMHAICD